MSARPNDPFVTPADKIYYGETLTTPVTLDRIKDVTALDNKRQELLEEAKFLSEYHKKLDRDIAEAENKMADAKRLATEYQKLR